jgi:hypothetical protein
MVELGLGLISIGRPWGHRREPPPPEAQALALLEAAVSLGVRFFDTAPAYGTSETILGRFLSRLGAAREPLFIGTKMGESWDAAGNASTVDHRYASLKASIDAASGASAPAYRTSPPPKRPAARGGAHTFNFRSTGRTPRSPPSSRFCAIKGCRASSTARWRWGKSLRTRRLSPSSGTRTSAAWC